jgi:DNA-binding MarR family transcriptional regulator
MDTAEEDEGHVLGFDPIDEARRQWRRHGWNDAAEGLAAVTSIMRVQQILLKRMTVALDPFPLSFARYEALVVLSLSKTGELPLSALGARLQVHPASVTNVIDRLERDGLVARTQHPTDRRAVLARIRPAGRRLAEKATAALNNEVYSTLEMTDEELAQLFDLLSKIRLHEGDFNPDALSGSSSGS